VRVGIDRPAAQATAPVERLAGGQELSGFTTVNFAQLAEAWGSRQVHVLDVRREGEWDSGHVRGAQHIPLHELVDRIDEVPDQHVWVHCASGVRASIAASLLEVGGKYVTAIADDMRRPAAAALRSRPTDHRVTVSTTSDSGLTRGLADSGACSLLGADTPRVYRRHPWAQ
jgi:hydroxyacylglutathione hydrolase